MSEQNTEDLRLHIAEALEEDNARAVAHLLDAVNAAQIADLLESTPPSDREQIWPEIDKKELGQVLIEAHDDVRDQILGHLEPREIADIIEQLQEADDQADLLLMLPPEKLVSVLYILDRQKREKLEELLSYPEDTAGGLMDLDPVTIRADVTLDVVLRYLRMRGELPRHTDQLFVTDRHDRYIGVLPLTDLLTHDEHTRVAELMRTDMEAIPADMPDTEVARIFEDHDLISAPVVDEDGKLVGRITIDDVVDVIREEGDSNVLKTAGLHEDEDLFSPIWSSTRRRAIWLGVNLLTAFLASGVIGLFENTLDQVVALAILLTIVPSMGGIAGSQTLTLVIRGLATGQLGSSNFDSLVRKEITVGLLNGLLWALVVAAFTLLWFGDPRIASIIAVALTVNLLAGAFAGVVIPVSLRRLGIDPALAGSVVLTTVTDVVGVFAFLGLATLFLL